jgi:hypothetical protein
LPIGIAGYTSADEASIITAGRGLATMAVLFVVD